jgi:hypothetical protein
MKRKIGGQQPMLRVFVSLTDPHSFALMQVRLCFVRIRFGFDVGSVC